MVTFVNPISQARRNGVPVVSIRVKQFNEGETNNDPASVFAQIVENWEEIQLRLSV